MWKGEQNGKSSNCNGQRFRYACNEQSSRFSWSDGNRLWDDHNSAHREPDIFFEWAKGAEERGVKVIIAGAGKAAHLPGMCAALFPMPVIGIPMKTSDLGGVDSLYSIVQMPSGIPVATVAINGGQNAGILAAKILATSDAELLAKL